MTPTREAGSDKRKAALFADGVCAALAVIASHDAEAVWREVVAACGGYIYLHGISKRNGNLRIDGFVQYQRENR